MTTPEERVLRILGGGNYVVDPYVILDRRTLFFRILREIKAAEKVAKKDGYDGSRNQ